MGKLSLYTSNCAHYEMGAIRGIERQYSINPKETKKRFTGFRVIGERPIAQLGATFRLSLAALRLLVLGIVLRPYLVDALPDLTILDLGEVRQGDSEGRFAGA